MKKGQMFSLDFLISLVALTAAIGLLIQAVEINTYTQKEEREFTEMKAVAETAANLIVAGNDTTCYDPPTKMRFMNCVDDSVPGFKSITDFLDRAGYEYSITADDGMGNPISLKPVAIAKQDFYEVKRQIRINDKVNDPTDLLVKVWKEP